jgi:hypothetical protein
MIGTDMIKGLQARHARHQQIQQDDVKMAPRQQIQTFFGIFGLIDIITLAAEQFGAHMPDPILIVDNQHAGRAK